MRERYPSLPQLNIDRFEVVDITLSEVGGLNESEMNEYKKISSDIEEKLGKCELTADDLFRGHLHFGKKFIDPIGIYIVFKKGRYVIYHLNIRGIESIETFNTEDELVFQIIWNGIIDYAYRTNKCNAHKKALELIKIIDCNYYNIVKE